MLRTTLILMLSMLAAACMPRYATPEALVEKPGSVATIYTALPLDDAYRKAHNQMKSCGERGGFFMVHMSVYGDKNENDAMISWGMSGISGHRVFLTARLTRINSGTRIDVYSAAEKGQGGLPQLLDYWLNQGGSGCELPENPS